MPGTQVVRVATYTKSAMSGVGREQVRCSDSVCRNQDIDSTLTHLNVSLKNPWGGSIGAAWHHAVEEIGAQFKQRKDAGVMDQMIITSGPEFFQSLGWKHGQGMTPQVEQFFREAYTWAVEQVGYQASDRNILAATIHLDETTPHMHVAFVPVAESWRRKVYAKDKDGKVRRTKSGSPVVAKDEHGKQIYELVDEPRLNRSEFWSAYGGAESERSTGRKNISYSLLQDSFQVEVGARWGLDRGEVGSNAHHVSHHKKKMKDAQQDLAAMQAQSKAVSQDISQKKKETEVLKGQLGDVATAVDLQSQLPKGKVKSGLRGSRVVYTLEEDAKLHRVATTGLLSQRLEAWHKEDVEKNRALSTEVVSLRKQVQSLQPYKEKAARVPDLEFRLRETQAQLDESREEAGRLRQQLKALKDVVIGFMGALGHRINGAVDFVKDQLYRCGFKQLAGNVRVDPQQEDALDQFLAKQSQEQVQQRQARRKYRSWDIEH